MKSTVLIIAITLFSFNSFSQEKKSKVETSKFVVKGVCNMCKERIENAALIKGVKFTEWDKTTDTLTVIYRTDKQELMKIHESIAEAGHTTDKVKCNMDAYNKLPACCQYMGDVKKH
jgi:mercuric ion binding protein